ncbi:glycan biosynthesis hexose transferase WsfD [Paenibacillus sp. 481]|uniref:glycan biosynthesis hexose transferase WsfD n=1 Tax=Paenibacillus sp. 481 TaxID=2835869 RepID=UPI001E2DF848|nr:hypothetical protein [Paenibacillus sp. 481]UHA74785.1 hypothetical protein KIK04_06920 [Paenibacillus sp. 481]
MRKVWSKADWITWGALVIGALLIVGLLWVRPYIGVADNGDFSRIMKSAGVMKDASLSYTDQYFYYSHSEYPYGPFGIGYASSQVIVVFIAGLLGRIWDSSVFHMEVLGFIYATLMLFTLYIILKHVCGGKRWLQITAALCLFIVFFDVGYIAYFQSFFGEPLSMICLLLSTAAAIVLAIQQQPSNRWLWLLFVAAFILATSKIQNAPVGFAFALFAFRLYTKREDVSWKRIIIAGSVIMLATTAFMYMLAPKELKHINLYQTIFFGILKDSPHVKQDLQELGIPEKYAVLAGTNYFQTDVAIKQNAPELREHVYNRLGHVDVLKYYLRHPERFIDKLEAAATQAMMLRPYYLGNYEQSLGKARGELSYTHSWWSELKRNDFPPNLIFYVACFAIYIGVIVGEYFRKRYAKHLLDVMLLISLIGMFSVVVPLAGDGEADLGKHLFLFSVSFDIMIIGALIWIVAQMVQVKHSFGWRKK